MQLRHHQTVIASANDINRVTSMCWSPDGMRLAVVTTNRIVMLFDENYELRDKFATKPAKQDGPKTFTVREMVFSPDSAQLAVAQSDNVVFVYNLGNEWGAKKSISARFEVSSSVTSVAWPSQHQGELIFGTADGKVKLGNLRSRKSGTIFNGEGNYVCRVVSGPDGHSFLSAHLDGTLYRFSFEEGLSSGMKPPPFAQHSCPPFAIGWGEHIMCAGNDKMVTFYDGRDGSMVQRFDYTNDDNEKEFCSCAVAPNGQSMVIGSFDHFRIMAFSKKKYQWQETALRQIENAYTLTSAAWKHDGSRVVVGTLCGGVEAYDACLRRYKYQGTYEITYVSNSQVVVEKLSSGAKTILKSQFGYEINKVNIYQDQYIVCHTAETLLIGDMTSAKLSEVAWQSSGQEKFHFDYPGCCMIFNPGELSLVEYGSSDVLAMCRTEFMNLHLISVRINERNIGREYKLIAYLIDQQTIHIVDMMNNFTVAVVQHDTRIDWLELNGSGTQLLYRDKRRHLRLFNVAEKERTTMLNYCSYVQWVPGSDVVVAQNRNNLCVWYSIDSPEQVTVFKIKGDIVDIVRNGQDTEVFVDEGLTTSRYVLDNTLIGFGTAMEDKDYESAIQVLENLELGPETEAMWSQLSDRALEEQQLHIAERCFAARGDIAKTYYLHQINTLIEELEEQNPGINAYEHYRVRAKIAILNRQFKVAEAILLENGKIEDAMRMYLDLNRWDDCIALAESKNHPSVDRLRKDYFSHLLQTGQEEKAGQLKEREGDYKQAVILYLKGGLPGRAAQLFNQQSMGSYEHDLQEKIADHLFRAGLFEKAGDFFAEMRDNDRALDAYKRGNVFKRAIELCRNVYPKQVVVLEEQYGDYLVSNKQLESAINHYMEAGKYIKAIEAAIEARMLNKAAALVEAVEPEVQNQYYKKIARRYHKNDQLEKAEVFYVRANMPEVAVKMYTQADRWDKAYNVASEYMQPQDVDVLYIGQAQRLESQGKFDEAEKMYLTIQAADLAIEMYRKNRDFDNMFRLLQQHRPSELKEEHLELAGQMASEHNYKGAESHYIAAGDWKAAVNMYRKADRWEDAITVAKLRGGPKAATHVAFAWAYQLGGEEGARLLTRLKLIEPAIVYACEVLNFEHALELAHANAKHKLPDIYLAKAIYLEDEGEFKEAEDNFLQAEKPREAVLMYIHQKDWLNAVRVAEAYDADSIVDVSMAQAKEAVEDGDFTRAESFYLRAKKPELMIEEYKAHNMWDDAIRLAEEYERHNVRQLKAEYTKHLADASDSSTATSQDIMNLLDKVPFLIQNGEFDKGIDAYLKATEQNIHDHGYLEEVWQNAVRLANSNVPERREEVVDIVAKRLIGIGRHQKAASMYEGIQQYQSAINVYVKGNMWEEARACARTKAPGLSETVEGAYVRHLKQKGNIQELIKVGNVEDALEMYADKGDWEKCMEIASGQGSSEVVNRYATMYAQSLIESGDYLAAIGIFNRYGVPATVDNMALYRGLAHSVLGRPKGPDTNEGLPELRQMLFKLAQSMDSQGTSSSVLGKNQTEFKNLLFVTHLLTQKQVAEDRGLLDLAAKISISLLRYCDLVPVDRVFYEAGEACKAAGRDNMAWVIWSRLLDIMDAVQYDDMEMLSDNQAFALTDVPYQFELPKETFADNDTIEAARTWVLANLTNSKISQEIETRQCSSCGTDTYEAGLSCHSCRTQFEPCVVTGYPIGNDQGNCKSCYKASNRTDWNDFLAKVRACPWCGTSQSPSY